HAGCGEGEPLLHPYAPEDQRRDRDPHARHPRRAPADQHRSVAGGQARGRRRSGAGMNKPATSDFVGTMPVREKHQFDAAKLEQYLAANVAGFAGPVTVEQFKGGQSNPTYKLLTPKKNYVLRRKPPGKLLASAHAVDREYRVITALDGSTVPVA